MKIPIFGMGCGSMRIRSELRIKLTPRDAKKSGFTGIKTKSQQLRTLYESSVNDGGQSKSTKSYLGTLFELQIFPKRRRIKSFTPSRSKTSNSCQYRSSTEGTK